MRFCTIGRSGGGAGRASRRWTTSGLEALERRTLLARLEILAPGGVAAMASSSYPLEQAAIRLGEQSFHLPPMDDGSSKGWVGRMSEGPVRPTAGVTLGYEVEPTSQSGPATKRIEFRTYLGGLTQETPVSCRVRVGTSGSGSAGDIGTPLTIRIQPEGDEMEGDPVGVHLDALFGASPVSGNTTGQYQVTYQAQGSGGTVLSGSYGNSVLPAISRGVTFGSSIGRTFQVVADLSSQGTFPPFSGGLNPAGLDITMRAETVARSDLAPTSLTWNDKQGGVDFGYQVRGADLTQDTSVALYWAKGPNFKDHIGDPVFTKLINTSADKEKGDHGPFHVPPTTLGLPPARARYLLVVTDPQGLVAPFSDAHNVLAWKHNLAGIAWFNAYQGLYPDDKSVASLAQPFRGNVEQFLAALGAAHAHVKISSTRRPHVRAYLMHYSFDISHNIIKPSQVQPYSGVDIRWDYGNDTLSRQAAAQMAGPAGFQIVHRPAFDWDPNNVAHNSRHVTGRAIDMTITWTGTLHIKKKNGQTVAVTTMSQLYPVGASYGVFKLISDAPHWSSDGH